MGKREQAWSDDQPEHGRILVLSDNPISRAIAVIASTAGRTVVVESADDGGPGLHPRAGDAVVLCDHDAPDAPAVLRAALASDAAYVAMMASRRRAAGLLDDLPRRGRRRDRAARAGRARPRRQGAGRDRAVGGGRDRGGVLRPLRRPDARLAAAPAQTRSTVTTATVQRPQPRPGPAPAHPRRLPERTYAAWSAATGSVEDRRQLEHGDEGLHHGRVDDTLSTRTGPSGTDATMVASPGKANGRCGSSTTWASPSTSQVEHRAVDDGEQPVASPGEDRERPVALDVGEADPPRAVVGARQPRVVPPPVAPRLGAHVGGADVRAPVTTSCRSSRRAAWSTARR